MNIFYFCNFPEVFIKQIFVKIRSTKRNKCFMKCSNTTLSRCVKLNISSIKSWIMDKLLLLAAICLFVGDTIAEAGKLFLSVVWICAQNKLYEHCNLIQSLKDVFFQSLKESYWLRKKDVGLQKLHIKGSLVVRRPKLVRGHGWVSWFMKMKRDSFPIVVKFIIFYYIFIKPMLKEMSFVLNRWFSDHNKVTWSIMILIPIEF